MPRDTKTTLSGVEFAGIGVQFAGAILIFALLGNWLDRRLGTGHWLVVVGIFLGAGGGFASLYRKTMATQRRSSGRIPGRDDGRSK